MFILIRGINLVYGESATGKSTLAMQEALREAKENKKIAFIDTENSFSIERIKQMNKNYNKLIKKIFLFRPKDFLEQHELIKRHYRAFLQKRSKRQSICSKCKIKQAVKNSKRIKLQDINNQPGLF